jgi:hypothetical protein
MNPASTFAQAATLRLSSSESGPKWTSRVKEQMRPFFLPHRISCLTFHFSPLVMAVLPDALICGIKLTMAWTPFRFFLSRSNLIFRLSGLTQPALQHSCLRTTPQFWKRSLSSG